MATKRSASNTASKPAKKMRKRGNGVLGLDPDVFEDDAEHQVVKNTLAEYEKKMNLVTTGPAGGKCSPKLRFPNPPMTLPCYQKGQPSDGSQYDKDELDRQIEMQQHGLNDLSLEQIMKGDTRGGGAQTKGRKGFSNALKTNLTDHHGGTPSAGSRAISLTKTVMDHVAALHNPDLILCGTDRCPSMGDRGVNSSLGSQSKNTVHGAKRSDWIRDAIKDEMEGMSDEQKETFLKKKGNFRLNQCKGDKKPEDTKRPTPKPKSKKK